jgi:hypothetical protein
MGKYFLVDFFGRPLNIPYAITTTGIFLRSVGSRLQTDLLTLNSRLGKHKIDNGSGTLSR